MTARSERTIWMIGVKLTQPLRRNAELFPDRIATVAGEARTSWGSTLDRVARLGAAFRNLGVSLADRIAVLSLNSDSYIQALRSEEHTSELQSLMRISYAVFCLKKKKKK